MITFHRPHGHEAPVETLIDKAHTFIVDVYKDDVPATVSAASVAINKPDGTAILAKTSVSPGSGPEGSSNRLSYALAAASIDTLDENYTLIWYATVGGIEHEHRVLYDVVKTELALNVTEEDLFVMVPALREKRKADMVNGVADSGSTTTLGDTRLRNFPDDHFNGGRISIIDGTNESEWRTVSDFAQATGLVTVSEAFPSAIDNSSKYRIVRSWEALIRRAFLEIKWRIKRKGLRPALILDSFELYLPTIYLAAAMAFEALATEMGQGPDGANWEIAEEYRKRYEEAFVGMNPIYDEDEDAVPDEDRIRFGILHSRML